jgi:hypothetical protein
VAGEGGGWGDSLGPLYAIQCMLILSTVMYVCGHAAQHALHDQNQLSVFTPVAVSHKPT